MRRLATLALAVAGAFGLVAAGSGAGEDDAYRVRAAFDNAGFLVPGEEVRIAGASVGVVESVDVSTEEEAVHADGSPEPGKALVVMRVDDPGFQDFRADASCLIRPQSLLGEKFVECEPTQPRAPGSVPPPPLDPIAEGEPGEGELLLPLERNGKAVDLDLVNNIMREPYPDRFRLILNDLGAGLAARGEELEAIVERGNPALRETNEVLAILAGQTRRLEQLARDGERSLGPLARERDSLSGFINQATVAGEATAERSAELEAGFQRLPGFLGELRLTMGELEGFADQATPVLADLGDAAPALDRSTRALGPFADAATGAFVSLGRAGERATPDLVASEPVIRQLGRLADEQAPAARQLRGLLRDLRTSGGTRALMRVFYFGTGVVNGFDDFGHFTRAIVPVNNCFGYETVPEAGCDANFTRTFTAAELRAARRERRRLDRGRLGRLLPASPGRSLTDAAAVIGALIPDGLDLEPERPPEEPDPGAAPEPSEPPTEPAPQEPGQPPSSEPATGAAEAERMAGIRTMLDFLVGPAEASR